MYLRMYLFLHRWEALERTTAGMGQIGITINSKFVTLLISINKTDYII